MLNKDLDVNKRAIVVGNSTSVLSQELGEIIDSYDVVVRVNHCPTKGYEKFIGKKINIWATTKTTIFKDNFVPEDFLNLSYIWHRTDNTKLKSQLPEHKKIPEYIMYKNDDFKKNFGHLIDNNWFLNGTNQELCTGLLAILTSTLFYKDVTIVGFTFYTEENAQKNLDYSYYRRDQLDSQGKHQEDVFWEQNQRLGFTDVEVGKKKKQLLKKMSKHGIIKILNEKEMEETYENSR